MCDSIKSCEVFLKLFLDWEACGRNYDGLSSGLMLAWNDLNAHFKAFFSHVGIVVEGSLLGLAQDISIINLYGPYNNRNTF